MGSLNEHPTIVGLTIVIYIFEGLDWANIYSAKFLVNVYVFGNLSNTIFCYFSSKFWDYLYKTDTKDSTSF